MCFPAASRAEPLLSPLARGRIRGIAKSTTLAVGRTALGELRGQTRATLPAFPLGVDGSADLELRRFDPFAPAARIEVVDAHGAHALPLPDATYWTGTVRGEPESRAFLVAGTDSVHGFVIRGGNVYPFGPDAAGRHRTYALRDVDPATYPPPGDFCANDLHAARIDSPLVSAPARAAAGLAPPAIPRAADTTLLGVDVAVETDYELRAKFSTDQQARDYLASLAAAASAIYERDVNVRLRFSYVRIWATSSDPWNTSSTIDQLDEVQGYWTNPANNMDAIAGSHDMVHFVSGKSVQGGIAYVGTVCDAQYGFGVSQVFGSFDLSDPSQIWDVLVAAHEMGHNLGSPHTHCYNPPVDECYNQESGCYSGPVVASRGTVMSYCHLLAGGLSNIDLVFGDVVSARIRATAESASCLSALATCGDGVVGSGEQCDDGNTVGGDGCSAACQFEVCGNGIVDVGETCDDGNTTSGDGCSATCQREPRCGDGYLDPGEECDDGNLVAGDGCSDTCAREPRCGDGIVDPGETCDDGNTTSGDGCSATCQIEPCRLMRAGQSLWERSHMIVRRHGAGHDRISLQAAFAVPMAVQTLDPAREGAMLVIDDADGTEKLDVTFPAGARWVGRRGRWRYRDPFGRVGGIRRLEIADDTRGGVSGVRVKVIGRGSYPLVSSDLPVAVTIVLGDEAAGLAGACGRHAFAAGSCTASRSGSRLLCQ